MFAALLLALGAQDPWHVRGVLVDEDDQPLVGVSVRCDAHSEAVVTNRGGMFQLNLPGPPASTRVTAEPSDRPGTAWLLEDPTGAQDLGRVRLLPGGTLVGRILGEDGDAMTGPWTASAQVRFDDVHRLPYDATASVDTTSGEFRITSVPVGEAQVMASFEGPRRSRTEATSVTVEPDAETYVELRYEGLDPARAVMFILQGSNLGIDQVEATVVDANGERRTSVENFVVSNGVYYEFRDLGPGPYRVLVDDERLAPIDVGPIEGGTQPTIPIEGSSGVALEVHDAAGRPVAGVEVQAGGVTTPLPTGVGLVTGLLPGTTELLVRTPDCLPFEWSTPALPPRAVLPAVIELPATAPLVVTCLDDQGLPLVGVTVTLFAEGPDQIPALTTSRMGVVRSTAHAEQKTDREGRATFPGVHDRRYGVVAELTPWLRRADIIEGGGQLEFRAPPMGEVRFEVRRPGHAVDRLPVGVTLTSSSLPELDARLGDSGFPNLQVPAGEAEFTVRFGSKLGHHTQRVQVPEGGVALCEFDLRECWPATLELEVHVDGQRTTEFETYTAQDSPDRRHYPAGEFTVSVADPGGRWFVARELDLGPGEHHVARIEIPLLRRRVLVIDANGEPVRNKRLRTHVANLRSPRISERTDDDGYLTLVRGPGAVFLVKQLRKPALVTLEVDGPETLEVRLRKD